MSSKVNKAAASATETDRVTELLEQLQPTAIPWQRRIFTNRNLRMASVTTIGFDMDYTLAEYHTTVEELAIRLTIERLVSEKNY